jgi:hypothetical protein
MGLLEVYEELMYCLIVHASVKGAPSLYCLIVHASVKGAPS